MVFWEEFVTTTKSANVRKSVLDRLEGGYALMLDRDEQGPFLFVGSESRGGESRVIPLDGGSPRTVTTEVGGMMHILPAPGRPGCYVSAMGMYAPFIGQKAGVYMIEASNDPAAQWKVEHLFDMPFAHRLGFLEVNSRTYLFVATVSKNKENPDDWSQPGELYVVDFDDALQSNEWKPEPVSEAIYRNHGMWSGALDGRHVLLMSGAEGMFEIKPDASSKSGFALEPIIEEEISEMVAADVDGDGRDEFVAIEPFHGHRLRVYKRDGNERWTPAWETTDLSFGHGLNVVSWGDRPLVVVGNRRSGNELLGFDFAGLPETVVRYVFDEGVGPTQIEPSGFETREMASFVSCNQGAGEVSLYEFPTSERSG